MNRADMLYDLSDVWAMTRDVFPYFDRLPVDWDEAYRAYLDKVLTAPDEAAFHALLTEMVASLQDGHTKYFPPAPYREARPWTQPEAPSHTYHNGVLTITLNEFLHDHSDYVRELLTQTPDVQLVQLDVRRNVGGNTFYAAKVAELFIGGSFSGCQKWTQTHNAVELASASQIAGYSEARIAQYIRDGLLTQDSADEARCVLSHTKYERYQDCHGAPGQAALYEGPLHLLISRETMSAAADFAAMFRSNHRAALLGEATYGSTGTPCRLKLRCGGTVQVVSVGYRLLDGTEFIGTGIAPDADYAD